MKIYQGVIPREDLLHVTPEGYTQLIEHNKFVESENLIRNGYRKVVCLGIEVDHDGNTILMWEVEK